MLCSSCRFAPCQYLISTMLRCSTVANNIGKVKSNEGLTFSPDEKSKILHSLNGEIKENLSRLNVPQNQIKKLTNWRSKKGPFGNINDVLDAEGMDVKHLVKICQSVVSNKPIRNSSQSNNMKQRQIVTPNLPLDKIQHLSSVIGLHVGPAGISWAKLSCESKKLDSWGFRDFSNLSPKPTSLENFNLARDVLDDIPSGDVYIFEASPTLPLQTQANLGPVIAYIQQLEFNSILMALLNTSEKHNKLLSKDNEQKQFENIVYYLKAKLAARLFKTWVGTEKVSAIRTVLQLFQIENSDLPCTPVDIRVSDQYTFNNHSSVHKELMSQALLLSIAFLDLCVLKNPKSIQATSPLRK